MSNWLNRTLLVLACTGLTYLTWTPVCQASDLPPENFNLIDSLCQLATQDLVKDLAPSKHSNILLKLQPHPADWPLESHLIQSGNGIIWNISKTDQDSLPRLSINLHRCGVELRSAPEDEQQLLRTVEVKLSASLRLPSGQIKNLGTFEHSFSDSFARQNLSFAQNSPYEFARAAVPAESRDFFDEVLEPLVYVSAAVVTVVLLFTVRSQ